MASKLFFGQVMHQRMFPMAYRFAYRVFGILIDIDTIENEATSLHWLGLNKFNLLSIRTRDHGPRDGTDWRTWVEKTLSDAAIHDVARVQLSCFPRVLGYGFNPIAVWYCDNSKGQTVAIISEVSNTFGGVYHYVHHSSGNSLQWPVECHADKRFHVSPFIDMNQQYHFKFSQSESDFGILINEYQNEKLHFIASQNADIKELNDRHLLKAFFMMPMMSFKIMFMIHWHAFKIWVRGGKFHSYDEKQPEVKSEWIVKTRK
ncbi:MAG: DUF1365 family protein [Methylophagaceae bacterium]|jgi:DUF1365 family protein